MTLTEQDNGRSIEARVGDVVTVRLKENPTTGYTWTIETNPELELIGDSREAPGEGIGAATTRVLQLRVKAAGQIRLANRRPWENDSAAIERFGATILVH